MGRIGGIGVHLVAMEEEVLSFGEGNLVKVEKIESPGRTDGGEIGIDQFGIDSIGSFAQQSEQNGAVGTVAGSGECKGAIEIDADCCRSRKQSQGVERTDEAESSAHGADGVRTGGTDTDLKELKEAGIHGLSLSSHSSRVFVYKMRWSTPRCQSELQVSRRVSGYRFSSIQVVFI